LVGVTAEDGFSVAGKDGVPLTGVWGPWSRQVSAQLAAAGIADLFIGLQGLWLSQSQINELRDTVARVVQDVCERSKPGDDLIGNISTAVGLVMWGAGYSPDLIGYVTTTMSTVLTQQFPGDANAVVTEMGQYFFAHDAGELLKP
jgi:hypothetical protein